jgi:hypothetical protein
MRSYRETVILALESISRSTTLNNVVDFGVAFLASGVHFHCVTRLASVITYFLDRKSFPFREIPTPVLEAQPIQRNLFK